MFRQRLLEPTRALPRSTLTFSGPSGARRAASLLPSVTQLSFWKALVPKFMRRSPESPSTKPKTPWMQKEWNPATFYIIIFLLIGSMSINMIALKKNFETYIRQSDVRIGLLREVVEKLQKGEKVDVEKVLGTGIPEKESEWEQGRTCRSKARCCGGFTPGANMAVVVLKEIEKDDAARSQKKKQAVSAQSPKPASSPPAELAKVEPANSTDQASFF